MAVTMAPDLNDIGFACRATGLLRVFNEAGVLGLADVHTAAAVARMARVDDEQVQLALALTVRALRMGSVCLDLTMVATTVFDESEEEVDVSVLPWPDPDQWVAACAASPLVTAGPAAPGARPLRLASGLLYLERYWQQEETVRAQLQARWGAVPPDVDLVALGAGLHRLFQGVGLAPDEPDRQRLAAAVSALSWVTVIAGGPGTGKTTTVARLLALLRDQDGPPLRIALAAPTGKAAARLIEAVRSAAADLSPADQSRLGDLSASTLHRLLGWTPESRSRFRHNARNHLPYDVVVVDEMSMVSLTMMARLLEAVRPGARLVLVGDPDQLSSVEAGAVLADITQATGPSEETLRSRLWGLGLLDAAPADLPLDDGAAGAPVDPPGIPARATAPSAVAPSPVVPSPVAPSPVVPSPVAPSLVAPSPVGPSPIAATSDPASRVRTSSVPVHGVVQLEHTWRYGGTIDDLARAIRGHDADATLAVLRSGADDVVFVEADVEHGTPLPDLEQQVRTAGRALHEAAGAGDIPAAMAALDAHRLLCAHRRGPYGVLRWSREVEQWVSEAVPGYAEDGEWYVGRPLLVTANDYETGLYNGDTGVVVQTPQGLRAAFGRGGAPTLIAPVRLNSVQTMHAMTVHRAQGSQFGCVSVVLPPKESPLLTRELLYTAATRAIRRVQIFGEAEAVQRAVLRPANRASGLRDRLGGATGRD